MVNKIIAITGMAGSGKTDAAAHLTEKGFLFLRFGQLTIDEVKKRNLIVTPENEKTVREELRKRYGMAAYAELNIPKIDELLEKGNVVIDGLYSWDEYVLLKKKYEDKLCVLTIYSSPKTRYDRLSIRKTDKNDKDLKKRPLSIIDAKKRDYAEIENIQKGGPIAMADYTIVNEKSIKDLNKELDLALIKLEFENIK